MKMLEINNLQVNYGPVIAVKKVDFFVNQGETVVLIGANGAGKSSTIGIIGTVVTKTSGKVKIFNNDIDINVATAKALLGVVSQEINFSSAFRIWGWSVEYILFPMISSSLSFFC